MLAYASRTLATSNDYRPSRAAQHTTAETDRRTTKVEENKIADTAKVGSRRAGANQTPRGSAKQTYRNHQ